MSEKKDNRSQWLHLIIKPQTYTQLHKQFCETTCRKQSEYAGKILLGKPVVATYRNKSPDDFMAEIMLLRKDLNSAGNNFNQAVKKLHALNRIAELKSWLIAYGSDRQNLLNKVNEIKNRINKISDRWLQ